MSNLSEIKRRIYKEDKIVEIFEALGCENIKEEQGGSLITAQLPPKFNSDNKRAVQCKVNEKLFCSIRNRIGFKGDIYSLVAYIKYDARDNEMQERLNESKTFICELFDWDEFNESRLVKYERIDYLKDIKSLKRKKGQKALHKPNKLLNENILSNFINYPIQSWIDEGIKYSTQLEYQIGFDLDTKRITIPYHNKFGQLIGVKGRLLRESDVDDEWNQKYRYIYNCNQSQEWFNLHRAIESIKNKNEIIIVEGEKSCMKFYQEGVYNVVAVGSSDISQVQKEIIMSIGLNIKIVLAYDNDKDMDDMTKIVEQFEEREVDVIYDVDELLPPKSAPIDGGIDIWNKLYKECKYNFN